MKFLLILLGITVAYLGVLVGVGTYLRWARRRQFPGDE
jgi:small basic protein